MSEKRKAAWKLILNMVTIVALIVLVYAVRSQIHDTIDNLAKVNAWALPFMLVWQALNYHSYAKMYQQYFRILGERLRYRSLLRVTLELNFVNNVFPSGGVSSFSYFSLRMKDADVPGHKSALVQLAKFITVFISFQILLIFGLLCLAIAGHANGLTLLVSGSLVTLLAVLTLGLGFVIGSKKRINDFFTFVTRLINRLIHVFRRAYPETINIAKAREQFNQLHENYMVLKSDWRQFKGPLFWGFLANLTELLTIYTVYVAFGKWVNPGAVILAYAVANFAGLISILPSGVGIYEALMTAVLAASGISPGVSLPVTIMYRVLNMLIQLPPGYYFYHQVLHPKPTVVQE
ncbi:MAG TPA: lysylphosphatidylglycerol synthase transmembrane domain-containing protein [Candidatus Saccharimonadales bacterium]|nr:lysylphosphatidylglycerol synthase transmembrane domain-containing protein [Candidatus Saccharimonadales bacterium]